MNKKIVVIALILMAIVVGAASASDFNEGYYRAPNGYVLVLMQNSTTSWTIIYMDDNGKQIGKFEAEEKASNLISFTAYGNTYRVQRSGNNNRVVESYGNRTYTYYQGLGF
ncbi:MAG: hypothetical protein LBL45_11285 [Treponema sp.]|jgi:hypothetical protein|nr:hypothetical protein [Treponema sp.]